jgi:bifunctional DNA-binding transcriptional regulator/antitoxin component of YhaV-PrlF toxin-antitoxin module
MDSTLVIEPGGKLTLPDDVLTRYGFDQNTTIRIIETQSGILLVPLTDEPMSDDLKAELEEWQTLGAASQGIERDDGKRLSPIDAVDAEV